MTMSLEVPRPMRSRSPKSGKSDFHLPQKTSLETLNKPSPYPFLRWSETFEMCSTRWGTSSNFWSKDTLMKRLNCNKLLKDSVDEPTWKDVKLCGWKGGGWRGWSAAGIFQCSGGFRAVAGRGPMLGTNPFVHHPLVPQRLALRGWPNLLVSFF